MKRVYRVSVLVLIVSLIGIQNFCFSQTFEEWAAQERKNQQDYYEKERAAFQQFVKDRDEAIQKMDNEFSDYLKQEWKNYNLFKEEYKPAAPKPKEKPVFTGEKKATATQMKIQNAKTIEAGGEMPRLPVLEKSVPEGYVPSQAGFDFYGSKLKFEYDNKSGIQFPAVIDETVISQKWDDLSKTNYNSVINDLNSFKADMNLNDWGYYLLVKNASEKMTNDKNGQIFLEWFILTKSNYKARLAFKDSKLFLLLPSMNSIYGMPFFTFDNLKYYLINGKENDIYTYDKDFPEARIIMDLNLYKSINAPESNMKGSNMPLM
jgi:hypothetical protein